MQCYFNDRDAKDGEMGGKGEGQKDDVWIEFSRQKCQSSRGITEENDVWATVVFPSFIIGALSQKKIKLFACAFLLCE